MRTVVVLLIAMLVPGCMGDPEEVSVKMSVGGGSGDVMVNEGGEHTSTRNLECGPSVEVDNVLRIEGGDVSIRVYDDDGVIQYARDVEGGGDVTDFKEIAGARGTWRLVVDRLDFSGSIDVTLRCG